MTHPAAKRFPVPAIDTLAGDIRTNAARGVMRNPARYAMCF